MKQKLTSKNTSFFKNLFNTQFEFKISFSNPSRSEILEEKVQKYLASKPAKNNFDKIDYFLKLLNNEDFIVFTTSPDEYVFVQFCRRNNLYVFDFPFSAFDKRSKLLHRLEYVLFKLKFTRKASFWKIKPLSRYYCLQRYEKGNSIMAYCGQDTKLAAKFSMMVFKEVYGLPENFKMGITIGSWAESWWEKIRDRLV